MEVNENTKANIVVICILFLALVIATWLMYAVDASDKRDAARRWNVTIETVAGKTTYTNVSGLWVGVNTTQFITEDGEVTKIKPVSVSYKEILQ